jgi:type IV secretion system protein VirB5
MQSKERVVMRVFNSLVVFMLCVAVLQPARAQLAVIDVPAIVQLIQEVQTTEQEVQTARDQLTQAQQALRSMIGDRGMQLLLSGTARNYLPTSWAQLQSAAQGGAGGYPGLASDVRLAIGANAVLSPPQLSLLAPVDQRQIAAARQASALQQALAQEALVNASGRFASIQTLVNAISSAVDQKGVLDLQARINAELGMLQNEQTKLQILRYATQAQESVLRQQQREQVIAAQGYFANRFAPVP